MAITTRFSKYADAVVSLRGDISGYASVLRIVNRGYRFGLPWFLIRLRRKRFLVNEVHVAPDFEALHRRSRRRTGGHDRTRIVERNHSLGPD
jgi:hypothetical protein